MGVKYIAGNKDTVGLFMRPQGYSFPVGLSIGIGSLSIDYLVVAGGGGGGQYLGGAGGAGGFLTSSGYSLTTGVSYNIIVGGGGTGGINTNETSNGSYSFINVSSTTALVT